jgi:hypothetical protein
VSRGLLVHNRAALGRMLIAESTKECPWLTNILPAS